MKKPKAIRNYFTSSYLIFTLVFAPAIGLAQPGTMMASPALSFASPDTSVEYTLKPGEIISEKIRRNLFVKAQVNKTTCYLAEPIIVTYKLYSRLDAKSIVTKEPYFRDFGIYDIVNYVSIDEAVEKVQGRLFKVRTLRKKQLIPLAAGNLVIDPIEINNKIHFIKASDSLLEPGNQLNDLLNKFTREESAPDEDQFITIRSKPVNILVKALPAENLTDNFNGAIGQFTISTKIISKKLLANDAATLQVEIAGTGNLSLLDTLSVKWPANIEALEVSSKEKLDTSSFPFKVSKIFNYGFIAGKPGQFTIPAIVFTYFDPAGNSYKTIQGQPVSFQVYNNDFIHKKHDSPVPVMRNKTVIRSVFSILMGSLAFICALSIFFLFILYLWKRLSGIQSKLKQNREIKTLQLTTDPLMHVRESLEQKQLSQFYNQLNIILWDTIATKLQLPFSDLNKTTIASQLKCIGWNDDMLHQLESILTECEINLYISEYDKNTDLEKALINAVMVLGYLNR